MRQLVLIAEAGGVGGLKASQEFLVGPVALRDRLQRVVGELVVIAIVAESGGALGKVLEIRLVLLFEKRILCGNTIGYRLRVLPKQEAGKSKKA